MPLHAADQKTKQNPNKCNLQYLGVLRAKRALQELNNRTWWRWLAMATHLGCRHRNPIRCNRNL